MNKVLLIILLTIEIQRYFITSEILLKLNLCILSCSVVATFKVESDKEKAETFNILFLQVAILSYLVRKYVYIYRPSQQNSFQTSYSAMV